MFITSLYDVLVEPNVPRRYVQQELFRTYTYLVAISLIIQNDLTKIKNLFINP
jgi:hypothetical protein